MNKGWLLLVLWQLLDNPQVLFALAHVPVGSLHFAQGNSAGLPCYKSFAAGSSMYPCQMACVSKLVPRDIISLSGCCPQMLRCAVDPWSSWGLCSWSHIRAEHPWRDTWRNSLWDSSSAIISPFLVPPLLENFLVEKGRRSLDMTRQVSFKSRQLWSKNNLGFL